MTSIKSEGSDESARKIYQITVQGDLKSDWRDWFNGMLIFSRSNSTYQATTLFRCKVRDQSELIGIINWLHNVNLVIVKMNLVHERTNDENQINSPIYHHNLVTSHRIWCSHKRKNTGTTRSTSTSIYPRRITVSI